MLDTTYCQALLRHTIVIYPLMAEKASHEVTQGLVITFTTFFQSFLVNKNGSFPKKTPIL